MGSSGRGALFEASRFGAPLDHCWRSLPELKLVLNSFKEVLVKKRQSARLQLWHARPREARGRVMKVRIRRASTPRTSAWNVMLRLQARNMSLGTPANYDRNYPPSPKPTEPLRIAPAALPQSLCHPSASDLQLQNAEAHVTLACMCESYLL
jgi:hypothetical protein